MARARAFYEKVMGQKVFLNFSANITFCGDFALQTRESWLKFI
jgi:hypothetical protein